MGPGCVPCLRTLWVGSSEAALGAQRPVARPAPGGGPAFFGRKPGERTPGLRPGPGFLWPLVPTRWVWGSLSLKRSRGYFLRDAKTDLGRIFRGKICWKAFWGKKVSNPLRLHPPKPSPWGEGGPAKPGRMRGRSCTQPFLVEKEGYRLSPQRKFSSAPLGNPVAPSSVTFGDSFPPKGKPSQVVHPCNAIHSCATPAPAKCASKSGHVHGPRNSPTTAPLRPTTPKRASGNERAIKKGVQGACPRPSFPHFSGEMGLPRRSRRPPGALRPEAPEKPRPPKGYAVPHRAPARERAGTHAAGSTLRRSQPGPLPGAAR